MYFVGDFFFYAKNTLKKKRAKTSIMNDNHKLEIFTIYQGEPAIM